MAPSCTGKANYSSLHTIKTKGTLEIIFSKRFVTDIESVGFVDGRENFD